jgi:hypothetical protein
MENILPPTSMLAQYVMWGMLIVIIILALLFYFHIRSLPDSEDESKEEEGAQMPPRTAEDLAERIATKRDPYN